MSEIDNNTTLKDVLKEIINSKKELKNAIDAFEARLLLKGKNINIAHEQTSKQRYESSILRKNLNLVKEDKQNTCYIKRNKLYTRLYVNENIHSVEDLMDEEKLANSAPSTPTAVDPTLPENRNDPSEQLKDMEKTTQEEINIRSPERNRPRSNSAPQTPVASETFFEDSPARFTLNTPPQISSNVNKKIIPEEKSRKLDQIIQKTQKKKITKKQHWKKQ
ncbi:unnamed protein product [Psylliodes chrysocephalus]|uniref:Uncharacterized protein n=1 Tax=Psylliodes chrysocephalus TaxID=3402493 RepID=A0A9P0CNR8_9CUCU|nr:unnamed protein product [Psylliodes chrysocephala]